MNKGLRAERKEAKEVEDVEEAQEKGILTFMAQPTEGSQEALQRGGTGETLAAREEPRQVTALSHREMVAEVTAIVKKIMYSPRIVRIETE